MRLDTRIGEFHLTFVYFHRQGRRGVRAVLSLPVIQPDSLPPSLVVVDGEAVCDSRRAFVREEGRKIALAKALNKCLAGYEHRHIRAELWFRYHSRGERTRLHATTGSVQFAQHALRRGQPLGFMLYDTPATEEEVHGLL
jgi:hypothetical protein